MSLIGSVLFNKVKKQFAEKGVIIKDFIFIDFKTKLFSIDSPDGKPLTADLSEYEKLIEDIESIYISKAKVTILKTNGEKIEQ